MIENSLATALVGVAERPPLGVKQILECYITGQLSNVNLEVQRDILTTVVISFDRATDLIEARLEIFLLPHPEDVVHIAVVHVEERVYLALGSVLDNEKKHEIKSDVPPGLFHASPIVPRTPPTPK